jgi:hypothetical protein
MSIHAVDFSPGQTVAGSEHQKGRVEARGIEIGLIETGLHSVDADAPRTTTNKRQGALEALDQSG